MQPTLGEIRWFGGNFAPREWALCEGQLLAIASNQALFSILGTTYGGDGRTTFALPDFRGRVAIGQGTGPALSPRPLGQKGGTETNILTVLNLPSHTHPVSGSVTLEANTTQGDESNATDGYFGNSDNDVYAEAANISMGESSGSSVKITVANAGANQPVNNMQPYTVVNAIICLQGLFPSRN